MSSPTCQPKKNKKVNNWFNIIQDYVFPPTCLLCNAPGFQSQDLCSACAKELPKNINCCYRCASSFDSAAEIPRICGTCLTQQPHFDETIAPFQYRSSIRYLIYRLKYQKQLKHARLLGFLLAEQLQTNATMPDCLMPVPLHQSRYIQRGFNQSIEIAKTVAQQLHIPLDLQTCKRIRYTEKQTHLDMQQRQKNLRNAFAIRKPLTAQHIAILDDVMTTGSTVNEIAKTLKNAGVKRVDIWVCARALMR